MAEIEEIKCSFPEGGNSSLFNDLVQGRDARLFGHDNIEVLPEMEIHDLTGLEK